MPPTLRRARRLVALPGAGLLVLVLVACGEDELFPPSLLPTPTPTAASAPPESPDSPPAEATPVMSPVLEAAESPSAETQVRNLLLRASLDLGGTGDRSDVDAVALRLEHGEHETWFVITTGLGVADILGRRTQVAAVFQRHANGSWAEVARQRLESTPAETQIELIEGTAEDQWIAVFGRIEDAGSTFELLRFDGAALTTALWWYSPTGAAARLVDLNGDGRRDLVLDASDPSILCPHCGVVDYREAIYRWEEGALRAVEFAALDRDGELAEVVAEGVRQAHAGLWREAASTLRAASEMDPGHAEVSWMAILAERTAAGRLAHAGSGAQPLLSEVLAGEYGAAAERMTQLTPEEAFAVDGPLIAGTGAADEPAVMADLLVEWASRAIDYNPAMHEAYAIRALGNLLRDPAATEEALPDMQRAAELDPETSFYRAAFVWLGGETPEFDAPGEEAPDTA